MPEKPAPRDWTVLSLLEWGTDYLNEKSVDSPRLSMEWLLSSIFACKRLDLYLMYDRPVSADELKLIKPMLLRRAKHEPLQYITGSTDFFGYEIGVNPSVLIPRPETEQLIEHILEKEAADTLKVLDLGTGSGCIPIALKKERPEWDVSALEVSPEAIQTARENAKLNDCEIIFFQGDFFQPNLPDLTSGTFDVIVSNPPYISESERDEIEPQVRDYEPSLALFHENTTLVYQAVADFARRNLKKGGRLYLEKHEISEPELLDIFNKNGWKSTTGKDYSDKERFLFCTLI